MSHLAIDLDDVLEAAQRIDGGVLKTPCIASERLSSEFGCQVSLKSENLQHIGAFKARGALNAVRALDPKLAENGVVTHSSGNHGAALTRAASLTGIPAHVVMPDNSAKIKIEAVRSYGTTPIFCEPNAESRDAVATEVQEKTGATLVHPYNDPKVMAGQGTVGLEILEQNPGVQIILAPLGGGGLLSGILTAVKNSKPEVQIIAVEPAFADDGYRSLKSGQIEMPNRYDTVADGLRSPVGNNPFPILQKYIDDIVLVTEEQIGQSMQRLCKQGRLVVEPSGAVAFAAVLADPERFTNKNVTAVISGGNVDFGGCRVGQY